jgi:asparagine N-glycosylation enzyme membrane subunit Stt3
MNTTKLLILLLAGPVAIILLLTMIRVILRKLRENSEEDFRLKPAYGLYFTGLLIAGLLIQVTAISHLAEAADNIEKLSPGSALTGTAKTAVLFTGLGSLWFLLWFLVTRVFCIGIFGLKKETEEMQLGNTYYFLVRSGLLIGLVLLMSPVLALLLRWLMPGLDGAFIH